MIGEFLISNSEDETFRFAANFAKELKGNEKILLVGELGSGKTIFVKGLAYGLGMKHYEEVSSPSFVLIKEYKINSKKLFHIDLYRIQEDDEFIFNDVYELIYSDELVIIEWAEKLKRIDFPHYKIEIEYKGEKQRAIKLNYL